MLEYILVPVNIIYLRRYIAVVNGKVVELSTGQKNVLSAFIECSKKQEERKRKKRQKRKLKMYHIQ